MHGARRKLSEPRIAGKASTAWLSNQRLTSASDSVLLMCTCVSSRTYCQDKRKPSQETSKKLRILGANLRFETETSYGMSTIRDLIPYEFGGVVYYALTREGVRCSVELPAEWLSSAGELISEDSNGKASLGP